MTLSDYLVDKCKENNKIVNTPELFPNFQKACLLCELIINSAVISIHLLIEIGSD